MAFVYHWPGDLQSLGERIRDKAISVTMDQAASYAAAQQDANNDATRSDTGQLTRVPGYHTPASGRPDDEANLRAYLEQAYAGIPALFTAFALPDPDGCRPLADALDAVAATVRVDLTLTAGPTSVAPPATANALAGAAPVGQMVALIKTRMKSWNGAAATAFEDYLTRAELLADLHRDFALSLALAAEVQLEINRRIITDIWEIGQKTLKALDGLDSWCPGANSSKTVALMTIGGAIAAVATVFLTEVTAGGFEVALAAAATQTTVEGWQSLATILGAAPALREQKAEIGGMTVPPVITGMQAAINRLTSTSDDITGQLANALTHYRAIIEANRKRLLLRLPDQLTAAGTAGAADLDTPTGIFTR
jgi:spore maturation protein SpmB